MSYGSRYIIFSLFNRYSPEAANLSVLKTYSLVWLLFNMCPFDIIFKISDRPSTRIIIQFLNSFADIQSLTTLYFSGINIFQGEISRVSLSCLFGMCVPILVDVADRYIFGQRNHPMAYSWNMINRWILFCMFYALFGLLVSSQSGLPISINTVFFLSNLFYLFLAVCDLIYYNGKVFYSIDFFPHFWNEMISHEKIQNQKLKIE